MFNIGFSELVLIAIIALIFITPKDLPEVARTLGRFLNDLKRASTGLTDELKDQVQRTLIDDRNLNHRNHEPYQEKEKTAEAKPEEISVENKKDEKDV